MESILENVSRVGNFTSSEIWKIMTNGKQKNGVGAPCMTYIEEKRLERRLGLPLKQEVHTKPISWGNIIEAYVHENHLGLEYESVGKVTLEHPTIKCWKGSPDFKSVSKRVIAECKAYERKRFAEYADSILANDVELLKTNHPEEYWQLVSNAIILGYDKIQPILFMPYKSELNKIREFASNIDSADQWKYRYIVEGNDSDLPYLLDGGYYTNLVTQVYEIPKEDIEALTNRVLLCAEMM